MKSLFRIVLVTAACAALGVLAGCMSNEMEPDRGPTPGIINLSY